MEPPQEDAFDATVRDARPLLDQVAREVMRARVVDALFGRRESVTVGRYTLLRPIGIGGGGVVFIGHDPELARDVAVKLIVAPTPALRARALAEGKALARLAHPNVVAVFDVGETAERVYLVMELIHGRSLREFARPRLSLLAMLRAWRQAGEGLAAAHSAGLVHRDFKPDNAVIGADNRVKVIDFGLAVPASEPTHLDGTPAYMSPEQRSGDPVTAASDQYAFGVALEEAARASVRDVPRWLAEIIARATAGDPAARYGSMQELLEALANDPRTRWRRRGLIAAPIVALTLGVGGFAIGRRDTAASCDATTELAPIWNGERAAAVGQHLEALATPFALAESARILPIIEDYASSWVVARNAICEAHRANEVTPTLLDRRIACVARARTSLDAALGLVEAASVAELPATARSLAELPDLARCADPDALLDDVDPPPAPIAAEIATLTAELDRARVGVDAATPQTMAAAVSIAARVRPLGYRPLLADALLVQGRAAMSIDQWDLALAPLDEAARLATAVGANVVAVEALARLMWVRSRAGTPPATILAGFDVVAALAERLGPLDQFPRALLYNNAGSVEIAAGSAENARRHLQTALGLASKVHGPGEVELAFVRANLALVSTDDAERRRLRSEATEILRSHLGDDHPLTLDAKTQEAFDLVDSSLAVSALRASCTRYAHLHPSYLATVAECSSELGWLELAYGARSDARAAFARVLAASAIPSMADQVELARAYLVLLDGDPRGAVHHFEELATRRRQAMGAEWWDLLAAAEPELGLAIATRAAGADPRGALDRAIGLLTRALAIQQSPALVRRLAWSQTEQDSL